MEPVREGIAYSYTGFEDIEEEFSSALDQSLEPSGPAMLLDVVGSLGLPVGCVALDVGSGEGRYAIPLAERFGFTVLGIDPVQAQIDRSNHAKTDATVGVQERVEFRLGRAEQLPVDDDSSSLVFCRDTLTLVPDLGTAYREFRRVLRADGRVVVYQLFPTERMEPREGEWLLGRPVAEVTATAAEGPGCASSSASASAPNGASTPRRQPARERGFSCIRHGCCVSRNAISRNSARRPIGRSWPTPGGTSTG
jgi:SAM-dependent methyltransferase